MVFTRKAIELITSQIKEPQDWECKLVDIKKVTDPVLAKFQSPKLNMYIQLLKKGAIFPPVVVTNDYQVIDGTHRFNAYLRLKRKKIPVLRALGKGSNQVKDSVYNKLGGKFVAPKSEERPTCYLCSSKMEHMREHESPGPMAEFPEGLPRGPFYFCRKDAYIINQRNYVIWQE